MLAEVTEHVNAAHRADLTIIARANGAAWAQDARLIGFDLAGLDLHAHGLDAQGEDCFEGLRVSFDAPVTHASAIEIGRAHV